MPQQHDIAAKSLFGTKEVLFDLIKCIVPPEIANKWLTYSWEKYPTERILGNNSNIVHQDLVWWCSFSGKRPIFIAIEFQSHPDKAIVGRIIEYSGSIIKECVRSGYPYPEILPIVLHGGKLSDFDPAKLMSCAEEHENFPAIFPYRSMPLYLNISTLEFSPPQQIIFEKNILGFIHNFSKYCKCGGRNSDFIRIMQKLNNYLKEQDVSSVDRPMINWIQEEVLGGTNLNISKYQTVSEAYMYLKKALPPWAQKIKDEGVKEGQKLTEAKLEQAREEGREEVREESRQELLYSMIEVKYGEVPEDIEDAILNFPVSATKKLIGYITNSDSLDELASKLTGQELQPGFSM